MNNFDVVKNQITEIITKDHLAITNKTNINLSGVYLLYVGDFTNDKVLPVYVGQSKDMQARYKQHITKLIALNHFDSTYYNSSFFSERYSRYEGNFYICKIFKYMVDNKVPINQLKMLVLETCTEEELDDLENRYIGKFKSSYFGFNQLNSFTYYKNNSRANSYSEEMLQGYVEIMKEDMRNLAISLDYGYSKFNLGEAFKLAFKNYLEHDDAYDQFLIDFYEFRDKYNIIFQDGEYRDQLEVCELYNSYKREIKNAISYQLDILQEKYGSISDKAKKEFTEFELSRYIQHISKNGSSKEVGLRVSKKWYQIGKSNFEEINILNNKWDDYQSNFEDDPKRKLELIEHNYRIERYRSIVPESNYSKFPLGTYPKTETTSPGRIENEEILDSVYLDLYFSSNTRKFNGITKPFLFRVELHKFENNECVSDSYFISNYETKKIKARGLSNQYFEYSDVRPVVDIFYIPNPFSGRDCFNPICVDIDQSLVYSSVSLNTQFKTGYSDLDICNNELINFESVLEEMDEVYLSGKKIKIRSNEGNATYTLALDESLTSSNTVIAKILHQRKLRGGEINIKPVKDSTSKNVDHKINLTKKERVEIRAKAYDHKIKMKFNGRVILLEYGGSNGDSSYKCSSCGHVWIRRSDRIFARAKCPGCKVVFQ